MNVRLTTKNGKRCWVVDYATGLPGEKIRRRKFFKTEGEAKRFAKEKVADLQIYGDRFEKFGPSERAEMAHAYEKARQLGITLNEALAAYIKANTLLDSDITIDQALDQFVVSREAKNLRQSTIRRYACQLGHFNAGRAHLRMAEVTQEDIQRFLAGNGWGTWTIISTLQALKTFFAWAVKRRLISHDPAKDLERPILDDSSPKILTVPQARRLIESCAASVPDFLPFVAIGLFAGARTAEIRKLSWDDIDLDRQFITIQGRTSKTRQRRVIDMSDNLKAWLKKGGAIPPARNKWKWQRIIIEAGWKPGGWPRNAMRHSCASYMLAANQSADKTALQLGHTLQMLFQHYRELVTPDQAREYWEIRP